MSSSTLAARAFEVFTYAEVSSGSSLAKASAEDPAVHDAAVRALGRSEGEAQARALLASEVEEHRLAIVESLRHFQDERRTYYEAVEAEVVQLALAIARKVLHREAQIDPLMLAGIVKFTLETLNAGTDIRVRVHPQVGAEWRHFFSCHMESHAAPEVLDDPAIGTGQCVLETSLGRTELGVEAQLKEIERGLLDLLARRPLGTS